MNYIVVDFEWNQALRSDAPVFNRLPIHLSGEIIEIGAVKLNSDLTPGEEFTIDVKPRYFRKMHFKVKKITGFDSERLEQAVGFPEAVNEFRHFCGEKPVFLTWGNDDKSIFEQNIIIHDLDWDWIEDWKNLQIIYNVQTGGDKSQKSLATAMDHFSIEQTRVAHDALGDAYNTALVCTHLDLIEGIKSYSRANEILAGRTVASASNLPPNTVEGNGPLVHDCYDGFLSKAEAFADERISVVPCPACGCDMKGTRWINQGDGRYMNLYKCKTDGPFLVRVKFKKNPDNSMSAGRLVYEADEEMLAFYKNKSISVRKRGRGNHHARRKA